MPSILMIPLMGFFSSVPISWCFLHPWFCGMRQYTCRFIVHSGLYITDFLCVLLFGLLDGCPALMYDFIVFFLFYLVYKAKPTCFGLSSWFLSLRAFITRSCKLLRASTDCQFLALFIDTYSAAVSLLLFLIT
jgi:hypothetical protein